MSLKTKKWSSKMGQKTYKSRLIRDNALWYITAFSSNSSCLMPVFSTNTELSSTSFTELMSTTEFLATSELS